ncbi:MAG: BON domain-containing protein [Ginsengibacter sp.]|jgi:copper chaperone CopZ
MFKFKPLVAIALMVFTAASCNNKPNDKEIQDNVTQKLQANENYAAVNSTVKNGTVTLTGMCKGDNCAADIEKNIKDVNGVQKVENNITKDNSTDLTMRTSVQSILTKYPGVQADVTNGVIVLRGTIDGVNLQSLMSELSSLHPDKIDNQLLVK